MGFFVRYEAFLFFSKSFLGEILSSLIEEPKTTAVNLHCSMGFRVRVELCTESDIYMSSAIHYHNIARHSRMWMRQPFASQICETVRRRQRGYIPNFLTIMVPLSVCSGIVHRN